MVTRAHQQWVPKWGWVVGRRSRPTHSLSFSVKSTKPNQWDSRTSFNSFCTLHGTIKNEVAESNSPQLQFWNWPRSHSFQPRRLLQNRFCLVQQSPANPSAIDLADCNIPSANVVVFVVQINNSFLESNLEVGGGGCLVRCSGDSVWGVLVMDGWLCFLNPILFFLIFFQFLWWILTTTNCILLFFVIIDSF